MTLAADGASVTVADRNLTGAETVAGRIMASGGIARPAPVDVTDGGQVEALVASAAAAYGSVASPSTP